MKRNVLIESLGIVFMGAELVSIETDYICFKISEEMYSIYENEIVLDKHTTIHFSFGKALFHHHTKNYRVFK